MKTRIDRANIFLALTLFIILFLASLFIVNYIRAEYYSGESEFANRSISISDINNIPSSVFLDRWVGIEGVMAVSSSEELGWDLWSEAWREKFQEGRLSLYESRFIESPYVDIDKSKNHFVSLPGVIAFMYYPGSFIFLFFGMIAIGLFASLLESFTFRFAGQNWVLCSLMAQVVAYRLAGFGYVPGQSYLLFGSLILNVMLIFFAERVLRWRFCNNS